MQPITSTNAPRHSAADRLKRYVLGPTILLTLLVAALAMATAVSLTVAPASGGGSPLLFAGLAVVLAAITFGLCKAAEVDDD